MVAGLVRDSCTGFGDVLWRLQLGKPRGALEKTREYWGVSSCLPTFDPPSLKDAVIQGVLDRRG